MVVVFVVVVVVAGVAVLRLRKRDAAAAVAVFAPTLDERGAGVGFCAAAGSPAALDPAAPAAPPPLNVRVARSNRSLLRPLPPPPRQDSSGLWLGDEVPVPAVLKFGVGTGQRAPEDLEN